jgi:hypothetical protein
MQSELTNGMSQLSSDPAAYKEVVGQFDADIAEISNEEVKPAADKIGAVFVPLGDSIDAAATDPASVDPSTMISDYTTDLREATIELSDVCGTM